MGNSSNHQDEQSSPVSEQSSVSDVSKICDYVNGLELAAPPRQLLTLKRERRLQASADQGSATINDQSVMCFTSGVSGQLKEDVLNSTLLAQMAADKQVSHSSGTVSYDVVSWYNAYVATLRKIGWDGQTSEFSEYQTSGSTFSVANAIIQILQGMVIGGGAMLASAALNALKKLEGSGSNASKIFESCMDDDSSGKFMLGTCVEENGNVALSMGTFYLTGYTHKKHFLWVDMSSADTHLQTATMSMVLNNAIYSRVRDTVVNKLGQSVDSFIADLDI